MTIQFKIRQTELTFGKHQELEDIIRQRVMEDKELITEYKDEAKDHERRGKKDHEDFCKKFPKHDLATPYEPIPIKDRMEEYIVQAIKDEINRNFRAEGEV